MIHFYARLGIQPGATLDEIKSAFRTLAKKHHPDANGGRSAYFWQIKEAYDALSDNAQRESFERIHKKTQSYKSWKPPFFSRKDTTPDPSATAAKPDVNTPPPQPVVSRLMSIAIPRSGTLLFEGVDGKIIVEPTDVENLWPTTLSKFGMAERERLSRHIIQVKVTAERDLARSAQLEASDFGVHFRMDLSGEKSKVKKPIVVRVTAPREIALHFKETLGSIVLGDMDCEIRARLSGNTFLRANRIKRAGLNLSGNSRAFLARLEGNLDILLTDQARAACDGRLHLLRTVVEKESKLEILAPVEQMQAEVNGVGVINAKGIVTTAQCNALGNGYIRINELKSGIVKSQKQRGRIDVLKKPMFVPVSGTGFRKSAGIS